MRYFSEFSSLIGCFFCRFTVLLRLSVVREKCNLQAFGNPVDWSKAATVCTISPALALDGGPNWWQLGCFQTFNKMQLELLSEFGTLLSEIMVEIRKIHLDCRKPKISRKKPILKSRHGSHIPKRLRLGGLERFCLKLPNLWQTGHPQQWPDFVHSQTQLSLSSYSWINSNSTFLRSLVVIHWLNQSF